MNKNPQPNPHGPTSHQLSPYFIYLYLPFSTPWHLEAWSCLVNRYSLTIKNKHKVYYPDKVYHIVFNHIQYDVYYIVSGTISWRNRSRHRTSANPYPASKYDQHVGFQSPPCTPSSNLEISLRSGSTSGTTPTSGRNPRGKEDDVTQDDEESSIRPTWSNIASADAICYLSILYLPVSTPRHSETWRYIVNR